MTAKCRGRCWVVGSAIPHHGDAVGRGDWCPHRVSVRSSGSAWLRCIAGARYGVPRVMHERTRAELEVGHTPVAIVLDLDADEATGRPSDGTTSASV